MGMYTELVIKARVRESAPEHDREMLRWYEEDAAPTLIFKN